MLYPLVKSPDLKNGSSKPSTPLPSWKILDSELHPTKVWSPLARKRSWLQPKAWGAKEEKIPSPIPMLEATEAEMVLRLPLWDFQGKNALFVLIWVSPDHALSGTLPKSAGCIGG